MEGKNARESVLEKITLYDILGYFVPGALFLNLLICGMFPEFVELTSKLGSNNTTYIGLSFVIFSYVFGIAISSVSRWICLLIHKFCNILHLGNIDIKADLPVIEAALIKNGISPSEIEKEKKLKRYNEKKNSLIKAFSTRVFADIQTDTNYRRIHNYSSSESMYKNLALVFWLSAIFPYILKQFADLETNSQINLFCISEVIIGVIFWFRWHRFYRKKIEYTWYWFIKKYSEVRKNN